MKKIEIILLCIVTMQLQAQTKKNVLLICIDDLRTELKSFGADYIISPNIDALAKKGTAFYNHYVNSPSCGPSRYTMLTGTYGFSKNDALFLRAKKIKENKENVNITMPEWFKNNGYTTVSLGKVSHHPGGLGGKDWNDPNVIEMPNAWDKSMMPVKEWQHPRGTMHGLANGEIRGKSGTMDVFQSTKGEDTIYPDGLVANKAIEELEILSKNKKPFFFAVGIIKPHLPFGAPKKYYDMYDGVQIPEIPHPNKPNYPSTWHGSGEFFRYNTWSKDPRKDKEFAKEVRKHYAACVTYADAQVGKIIEKLKETKQYKNTIIVLWGDHGWSLGDHGIWGKHSLFEEALHSPLIILDPSIKQCGKGTKAVVETVDVFPTLCDLAGLSIPNFTQGVSLKSILENPVEKGHIAYSYRGATKTIRTDRYRLILSGNGTELYDHQIDPYETKNIASEYPKLVKELKIMLKQKYAK